MTIQKAQGCSATGMGTFMEKALTTKVGTMMVSVMMVSVFIVRLRLLETMETRASIRPARMLEAISACR